MECTSPGQMVHPKTGIWQTYRCGQCLPCRIGKQSSWMLRNLLECQTASSKSFWTLTVSEQAMPNMVSSGPRSLARTFFAALRRKERRAGNSRRIRYYGCFEYGGTFGRPHFHMLLYNLEAAYIPPSKRKNGLPAERFHIAQWPHGHIDSGTITSSSIRYVTKYLTAFEEETLTTIPFRTTRPAIGYYGVQRLAAMIAAKHSTLPAKPSYFQYQGRKYALDQWTKKTFVKEYRKAGGSILDVECPVEKKLQALSMDIAKAEVGTLMAQHWKLLEIEQRMREADVKKVQKEAEIEAIYNKLVPSREIYSPFDEDCNKE